MLLKTTTQRELCYTCHGTTGSGATTDVQGGVGYGALAGQALRGGGFEKALINTSGGTTQYAVGYGGKISPDKGSQKIPALTTGGQATTSSHSINGSDQTIWGNGAIVAGNPAGLGKTAVALECGSCHDPHGNKNYRILRPVPNDAGTQVARLLVPAHGIIPEKVDNPLTILDETMPEIPATADVYSSASGIAIPDQPTKVYTTTDYWQTVAPGVPATVSGVPVASPDGFIANVSSWCLTCHTRYEGKGGARTLNSGDPVFTYRHTTDQIDRNGTRNCITCHVAHGSNATMAYESSRVEMPGGAAPVIGNASDSRLLRMNGRGVCLMCHNK